MHQTPPPPPPLIPGKDKYPSETPFFWICAYTLYRWLKNMIKSQALEVKNIEWNHILPFKDVEEQ